MSTKLVPGILIVLSLLAERTAQALPILDCDEPIASPNAQFFALPGPREKTTEVYRWVWPTRTEKIWEKPDWHCDASLSDDGEYLVAGDDWQGQISRDYKWDQAMLRFYHRDTLIKAVPLREVLLDPKKVSWNDCSSMWASSMGFVAAHRFAVETADDRRMIYDVTTGALNEVLPSTAYDEAYRRREVRSGEDKFRAPPPQTLPPEKRAWPMVDADHPVYSQNRRFYALPTVERTMTQVFRALGRGRSEKVWEKVGWDDGTKVSNDGEYLVTGYPRRDVLDRKYTFETVMLTFYRRSTLIRAVPLREIIFLVNNLWEWPEGYEWGDYRGFVSVHRFAVDTVEDRRVVYDVTTGAVVSSLTSPVPRFWTRPLAAPKPIRSRATSAARSRQ